MINFTGSGKPAQARGDKKKRQASPAPADASGALWLTISTLWNHEDKFNRFLFSIDPSFDWLQKTQGNW